MIEKLYQAIQDNTINVNDISEKYKVSDRTVRRWLNKQTKPKLEVQYELFELIEKNQTF